MAELPRATARIDESGAGIGTSADYMLVVSPMEKGPVATIRRTAKVQDTLDEFGKGEGLEFVGHLVEVTKGAYMFARIATAVAAAIGPVDTTHITGVGSMAFSGTPLDEESLKVVVVAGFVAGTAGGSIKVSRDGGRTYGGGTIRMGTATTYEIPGSGITVTFSGTLEADDYATAQCSSTKWDADGLAAVRTAIGNFTTRPRIVLLCGDVDDADDVQTVIDEIEALETEQNRHTVVIFSARDRYPNATMQKTHAAMSGAPSDIDFAASGHTITRNTGSWITDGFLIGQSVVVDGSASNDGAIGVLTAVSATVLTFASGVVDESNLNGADVTIIGTGPGDIDFAASGHTITRNIGSFVTDGFKVGMHVAVDGSASNDSEDLGALTTVTATVLTFASGVVNEANKSGLAISITATEPKASWRAALELLVGSTPQTLKIEEKVSLCGGRLRRKSPITQARKRRPFSWPLAIRTMMHDLHISPAQVDLGGLEGWDIFDTQGQLEEHDERVDGGLLAIRIACATTLQDESGVYVALPLTLDTDNAPMSRMPITLVGQLACTVARQAYQRKLNTSVFLKKDKTIQEGAARKIDEYVRTQLELALLVAGPEGPRASGVTNKLDRTVDLSVQGAEVPWEVVVDFNGYLEKLTGTVRVGGR